MNFFKLLIFRFEIKHLKKMGAVIQFITEKVKGVFSPYLYNNRISPALGFLEHVLHVERSLVALGTLLSFSVL